MERSVDSELKGLDSGLDSATAYLEWCWVSNVTSIYLSLLIFKLEVLG